MAKISSPSKEDRKRQLVEAAIRAFAKKGYFKAQIDDVIREAGVARGTFYLYFKGKREIFDEIMSEIFQKIRDRVRTLPRDAIDQIPAQLLENLQRITELLVKEPWISTILFQASVGIDPKLDERLRSFYGLILDYIRRGLKQGQEMGFVREGDLDVLSKALLGTLKEVFFQDALVSKKTPPDRIAREIYSLVLHAIVAPSVQPSI